MRRRPVVILGNGEIQKKLTVKAHRATKSAEAKITEAGGSFEKLEIKLTGARATVKLLPKDELAKIYDDE